MERRGKRGEWAETKMLGEKREGGREIRGNELGVGKRKDWVGRIGVSIRRKSDEGQKTRREHHWT